MAFLVFMKYRIFGQLTTIFVFLVVNAITLLTGLMD